MCIRACESVGDVLALYQIGHPGFEGLMQTLHNRFNELSNHGNTDRDRIDENVLINLLGLDMARDFMWNLETFSVLPFALRPTGTEFNPPYRAAIRND